MNPTTEKIKAAADGLLFMSESDYPLEVFELQPQPTGEITNDLVLQWAGKPAGTVIEKTDLTYFFRNQVRDLPEHGPAEKQRAERFRKLQQLLQDELQGATVYRIGSTQVTALVIGKTKTGEYTGIKTTLIET